MTIPEIRASLDEKGQVPQENIQNLRIEMLYGSNISVQTVEAASMSSFPTISTSLMAASTFQGKGGGALLLIRFT